MSTNMITKCRSLSYFCLQEVYVCMRQKESNRTMTFIANSSFSPNPNNLISARVISSSFLICSLEEQLRKTSLLEVLSNLNMRYKAKCIQNRILG
jgi:hypothetical protein